MTGFTRALFYLIAAQAWGAEYLIKWKEQKNYKAIRIGEKLWGVAEVVENLSEASKVTKVLVAEENKRILLERVSASLAVDYFVPNKNIYAFGNSRKKTIEKSQKQWALEKVKAKAAWNLMGGFGSRSVVVAILDTGVDSTHESLAANMIAGYDFKDNDADPSDQTSIINPGHGTHCAGIAGALGDIAQGIAGMSPIVSILPVRILGKTGAGQIDDAVQGIDYAIEKGADVISASWSGEMLPSEAAPLVEALKRARDAGITFVTSSGNGDENGKGFNIDDFNIYPAGINLENVITVAATDEEDFSTTFSNFGPKKVHLAAPGYKILSTLPKNRYDVLSGTSMSAPLVAGLVALIKSIRPELSPFDIRSLLLSTGSKVDMQIACNCRVDAEAALKALLNH